MNRRKLEELIYSKEEGILESLAREARRVTRQRFGHVVQMYAPLYVSNECIVTCTYCGFSRPNKVTRRTLAIDEVIQEAHHLMAQGLQHILLVAGEHPQAVSPEYLEEIAHRLRSKMASLSIEVAPFDIETYRRLSDAGIDGVVVYQETYDQKRYEEVHVAGPKKDYAARLKAPERAARGGARKIGMGILVGLGNWRKDVLALIDHVQLMQCRYPQIEYQVSLPRLKPCAGGLKDPIQVSDADFARMIFLLRLALPEVGIVLSTREPPHLRDGLLSLGVTQVSAGSRTEPGGYLHPAEAEKQFMIDDLRPPKEMAQAVSRQNLEPVWKDWENILHG